MLPAKLTLLLRRKRSRTLSSLFLCCLVIFYTLPLIKNKLTLNEQNNKSNRIIFHETSGSLKLSSRQCCAVESAAKHNPNRPVQVFFNKPDDVQVAHVAEGYSECLAALRTYRNVKMITINVHDYFRGTPLEEWYNKGVWQSSPYKVVHLSDYIRMLSLYKDGGLYMDLDVISIRPLGDLANFFALEDKNCSIVPNSVLHLDRGHRFIELIIAHLSDEYDPKEWVFHGSAIMTAIMRDNCGFKGHQVPATNTCGNLIRLLPHQSFFPVTPENYSMLLRKATSDDFRLLNESYGVHVWNSKLRHEFVDVHSNQLFVELMKQHCPLTYSLAVHCKPI